MKKYKVEWKEDQVVSYRAIVEADNEIEAKEKVEADELYVAAEVINTVALESFFDTEVKELDHGISDLLIFPAALRNIIVKRIDNALNSGDVYEFYRIAAGILGVHENNLDTDDTLKMVRIKFNKPLTPENHPFEAAERKEYKILTEDQAM